MIVYSYPYISFGAAAFFLLIVWFVWSAWYEVELANTATAEDLRMRAVSARAQDTYRDRAAYTRHVTAGPNPGVFYRPSPLVVVDPYPLPLFDTYAPVVVDTGCSYVSSDTSPYSSDSYCGSSDSFSTGGGFD